MLVVVVVVVWQKAGGCHSTADRRREAQDISRCSTSDGNNKYQPGEDSERRPSGEMENQNFNSGGTGANLFAGGAQAGQAVAQVSLGADLGLELTITAFSPSEMSMWRPRGFQTGNSRASMMTTRSGRKT